MTRRLSADTLLLAHQWALSAVLFELGLVQAGLPVAELRLQLHVGVGLAEPALVLGGLLQALAAVLLVVPTVTGFWPRVTPLVAAAAAITFGAAAVGMELPVGLGHGALDAALALGCAAVAAGRGLGRSAPAPRIGPERRDPWRRPPALLHRRWITG